MLIPVSVCAQNSAAERGRGNEMVRFGFIRTVMGEINENDVKAALRAWTKSLTEELGIPAEPTVLIYSALSKIKTDLGEKRVDVVYITTPQLFSIQPLVSEDALLAVKQSGSIAEEYLLLVHQNSPANEVWALKKKDLRVLDNA